MKITTKPSCCSEVQFIRWLDSQSLDQWSEQGEQEVAPALVESIGWIYGETDEAIALAGTRTVTGQMSGIIVIPKVCILVRHPGVIIVRGRA